MQTRPGLVAGSVVQTAWRVPGTIAVVSGPLLGITIAADVSISPRVVVLTVFLGLAPLLAASALGPARTAGFAAAATVVAALSGLWNGGGTQYWIRLTDVALVGLLSVLVSALRAGREAELRESRRIAEVAQQALLPVLPHALARLSNT